MGRSKTRAAASKQTLAAPPPAPLVSAPAAEGVVVGPLTGQAEEARRLFSYVGAWAPPPSPGEVAWGAWVGKDVDRRLIGAVVLERKGPTGMLDGPVVVLGQEAEGEVGGQRREALRADPVEIAAQLVGTLLAQATSLGIQTLFARPQGLDRVWIRFGFIPVPGAELPPAFKGRPGTGLFAWRGGTALWSTRKLQTDEGPLTLPSPPPGARKS